MKAISLGSRPYLAQSWASISGIVFVQSMSESLEKSCAGTNFHVPPDLALGSIMLAVLALLFISTEEDAGVVGVGVLNLLAALDLFYSAQDPGLVVTGLLVMVNLLVGLAISYLTVVEVEA